MPTLNRLTRALADTASRVLFREATVTAVEAHGPYFRSIELGGDALKDVTWTVGDKIQVRAADAGLVMRTYTPTRWDPVRGSTTLLAYLHGTGPGSAWMTAAATGDACQFFGPRRSLKVDDSTSPVVFVGDETSFALVAAWRAQHPDHQPVAELFEVTHPDDCSPVLDAIGATDAELFARATQSSHLAKLSSVLIDVLRANPAATLCLTGKAQSIAEVRRALKGAGLTHHSTRVKAYWDEHRSGLD